MFNLWFEIFCSQWNSTSPSIGIHGNQIIGQEMRNDNKNDSNAMRRDSKISCYGTTGKVISNANQSDNYLSWGIPIGAIYSCVIK